MEMYIDAFLGCIINWIGCWYISDVIFQEKSKKNWIGYLIITLYSIGITALNIMGENSIDRIIKIIVVFVMMIFFNKYKYKRSVSDIILCSFIVFMNIYLSYYIRLLCCKEYS